MLAFSSKMNNLIAAVEKIKIGGGGGSGKKGGGGGGGADADAIDVAKTNSTKRLAEAKAVADLEFSKAKATHEYQLKAAKLRSQRNGKLDESVYQRELALAENYSKNKYHAAAMTADASIKGAELLNNQELNIAGATAKTIRNFENKANNQKIANAKNLQSVNQSHQVKSSHIELALDDQISQSKIAQDKKVEAAKAKAKAAADKASMSQTEADKKYRIDAAVATGDEALKNAKIAGDAAFAEAGRFARASLANAKLDAKMNTTLDARQRVALISGAKDASDAAFDGAKATADVALDGAIKAAQTALRMAGASRKEVLAFDRKIFNASVSDEAFLTQSKLASEEAVNNAKRNFNTQLEKEEIAKQKKIADAAKKGSRGGGGGGPKDKSMDFTGAKSFDPRAFFDSLRGGLISGIVGAATQGFAVFQKTRQNVSNATGGKGAPGGAATAAMGPIIGAAGAAVGAIGALSGGMMALFEMVGKFVGALDPALMQQLSLAFENLSAVIGIGLRPIITMAVVIIKAFGDALVPVMKQLEPVMTKLSMVLINAAVPFILMFADQIETLIPFIEALIPIIGLFGDLLLLSMRILIPPFKVLAGVLMIVVGIFDLVAVTVYMLLAAFFAAAGELKSWVPGFGDSSKADKQMAKDMVEKSKASANSAGEAMKKGANLIIDGVENSFGLDSTNKKEKPKPGGAGGAAAKGASFSGVADLGKNMMQAAFGSSTANVANKQLNQQKQINQSIEKIGGWLFGWAKPRDPAAGVRN